MLVRNKYKSMELMFMKKVTFSKIILFSLGNDAWALHKIINIKYGFMTVTVILGLKDRGFKLKVLMVI